MNTASSKTPLAEIAEHVTVGYVGPSSQYFCEDGVLFLRTGNVGKGRVILSNLKRVLPRFHEKQKKSSLKPGDVIVSRVISDEIYAAVVPPELDGANCGNIIVIRPGSKLDPRYLVHLISHPSSQRELLGRQVGSAQAVVNTGVLKSWKVPLLPIREQRRIAEILDRVEALRAKRRAALAQLDNLRQSVFLDLFGDPTSNPKGWPVRKIGDLLKSASYGTSARAGDIGEFPVLRMNNISRTGEIDLTDLKFMDLSANEKDRYLVRAGDVLFNRTNSADLVGKTGIYRGDTPMAYAGYLIRLRTNPENDPEYLASFLNTGYAKRMLRATCKSIIGMANINATEVQAMKIMQLT